jgi:hypothetical protein
MEERESEKKNKIKIVKAMKKQWDDSSIFFFWKTTVASKRHGKVIELC